MLTVKHRPLTVHDYMQLPEDSGKKSELIEGDLVVEILSPGSAKHDLGVKKEIYTRTGVEEFWSVDPVKRTITVFQLSDSSTTPRATLGEGKTLTTPLLPGLKIKVRDVFAE